jgi:superkiller protein 3
LILGEAEQLEKAQKWAEALAAIRRAEAAADGGEADTATERRVRERLEDLTFIRGLEQIRMDQATFADVKLYGARVDRGYASAFRGHGVDVDALAAEESVERLRARPALAIPLAAALDDWAFNLRQAPQRGADGWKRLVAVARGLDPEPLRDRVRATWEQPGTPDVQDDLHRLADSIDLRAHHPATLVNLARALSRVSQASAALRLLRDAQRAYPGDFWVAFELGSILSGLGDHEGAVRFYTAAVAIRPDSAAAQDNLGKALADRGRGGEAEAAYRKAIDLDPRYAFAHINLGLFLLDQGRLAEAEAAWRKALDLEKSAPAHNRLAWTLANCPEAKLRDPGRAVALAERAVELEPEVGNYWNTLGVARYRAGDWKAAAEALEKSTALSKGGGAIDWHFLAMAHWRLGHKDEARRCYDRVAELLDQWHPTAELFRRTRVEAEELLGMKDSAVAHHGRGLYLLARRLPDDAIEEFRQAIQIDPNLARPHTNLGIALTAKGRMDEALAAFQAALQIQSESAHAYFGLAWILAHRPEARLRDPVRAVAAARRAVDLKPTDRVYWRMLGWAEYRAGNWQAAIRDLHKVREVGSPGDCWEWFALAMAHWRLGHRDEARRYYDWAVEWMEQYSPDNVGFDWDAFRRTRAEAAELLGINEKKP